MLSTAQTQETADLTQAASKLYDEALAFLQADSPENVKYAKGLLDSIVKHYEYPPAMHDLARLYLDTFNNPDDGLPLLKRAAEKSHVPSMFELARLYQKGTYGVTKNVSEAKRLFESILLKERHAPSMGALATLLVHSMPEEHTQSYPLRAEELYKQAIEEDNHVPSMVNLATLYSSPGSPYNPAEAVRRYEEAIRISNDVDAMHNLACLLLEDIEHDGFKCDHRRAVELFQEAINLEDHVDSMYNLAHVVVYGTEYIPKDPARGLELYRRAIQKSNGKHVNSMNNLANLLVSGSKGIQPNYDEAKDLYSKALILQSDPAAMSNLALLYVTGGLRFLRNIRKAIQLLEDAIDICDGEGGQVSSMKLVLQVELAILLLSELAKESRDPERAKNLLEEVVQSSSYKRALHELALLYERGDVNIPKNPTLAQELHEKARNEGEMNIDPTVAYTPMVCGMVEHGSRVHAFVESVLSKSLVKPLQCFVMTLGGSKRGKSSILRSLVGDRFEVAHISTELASLARVGLRPGERHLKDSELDQLFFNTDSLTANITRADEGSHEASHDGFQISQEDHAHGFVPPGSPNKIAPPENGVSETWDLTIQRSHDESTSVDNQESPDEGKNTHASKRFQVLERTRALMNLNRFPALQKGGMIQMWDLGGQSQYFMAHSLFIGFAKVLLFVINLEDVSNKETRTSEIQELCRWIELAFVLCTEHSEVYRIIVGTHKMSCGNEEEAWSQVRRGLEDELGESVYNTWVKSNSDSRLSEMQFVAVENSISEREPEKSGISTLEKMLEKAAAFVVESRKQIPASWVALVEELEKDDRLYWTKHDLDEVAKWFPGFPRGEEHREKEVLNALKYYRELGRIVLFEMEEDGREEIYAFMNPQRIVDFLRQVTGPEDCVRRRLKQREAKDLRRGLITREALKSLWAKSSEDERNVMLQVLCSVDLMMHVTDSEREMLAIPALLPTSKKKPSWVKRKGHVELNITTTFEDAVPAGFIAHFFPHLFRTLQASPPKETDISANLILLALRSGARVAVIFVKERRQIKWIIRSEEVLKTTRYCLQSFEGFIKGPLRKTKVKRYHCFTTDCLVVDDGGCGGEKCLNFKIPERWINYGARLKDCVDRGRCLTQDCPSDFEFKDILDKMEDPPTSDSESTTLEVFQPRVEYDVFISYTKENRNLADAVLKEFKRKTKYKYYFIPSRYRVFLDEEELGVSERKISEQLRAAMDGTKAVVCLLSPGYVARKWPMWELRNFLLLRKSKNITIVPAFHELSVDDCWRPNLPEMPQHIENFEKNGFFNRVNEPGCSIHEVMEALRELPDFFGVVRGETEGVEEFAVRLVSEFHNRF